MAHLRKSAAALSAEEWRAFIEAVNALHGNAAPRPRYRDFVQVHVEAMSPAGMAWGVHSMPEWWDQTSSPGTANTCANSSCASSRSTHQ